MRCKAKTAYVYRLTVEKHILPTFGKTPALGVGHAEVTGLHHSPPATPVAANRAVDVLSRIYNAAEDRGRIQEASNPCRLVAKFRERARERFLTDEEFRRLGRALDEAGTRRGVGPCGGGDPAAADGVPLDQPPRRVVVPASACRIRRQPHCPQEKWLLACGLGASNGARRIATFSDSHANRPGGG